MNKELLDLMLKIRWAEEKIVEVYAKEQQMRTPTHLSIGQEAVAAGLALALRKDDQVFTGHRCHAAFLAKGGQYDAFFAELCGRASGISGGRAGSAHLTDPSVHVYSSPILGAMVPVAVGAALSFKMDRKDNIAVALFGDAAIEEGAFAESVNFAVTKRLPVLFICENNLYSTHSPLSVRQPPSSIHERLSIPEMPVMQIDGNDAGAVYKAMKEAAAKVRGGSGPVCIECLTYRVREHVGPLFDHDRGYRTKQEVDAWTERCPVARWKKHLSEQRIMTIGEMEQMEDKWARAADEAYARALKSQWPSPDTLLDHVY